MLIVLLISRARLWFFSYNQQFLMLEAIAALITQLLASLPRLLIMRIPIKLINFPRTGSTVLCGASSSSVHNFLSTVHASVHSTVYPRSKGDWLLFRPLSTLALKLCRPGNHNMAGLSPSAASCLFHISDSDGYPYHIFPACVVALLQGILPSVVPEANSFLHEAQLVAHACCDFSENRRNTREK